MTETLHVDQNETPFSGSVESDLFELEMTDFGPGYVLDNATGACQCTCVSCLCVCYSILAEEAA